MSHQLPRLLNAGLCRFTLVAVLCWFTLLAATTPAVAQVNPTSPNILLLLSDDHSYPFVGAYDCPSVRTPVLDELARSGMRFHRFFTGAPQCVPSRACLMTGRSAVATRMTRFSAPLPRSEVTLPELLREHGGYHTGICGRSFHLDGASRNSPALTAIYDKHQLRTFADRVDFLNSCSDPEVPVQVRNFLQTRPANKPFFLWANFSDPHHPWNAPAEFRPDPASLRLPPHWPDLPDLREQLADYFAEINRLDQTVGKVLDVLRELQLDNNTIVVFCGDNGAALPHGKGSLYDPGSNVPFLVRWPGVIRPGSESRQLLSGEDLAPALLDAAGIAPHPGMSGVSFLPALRGEPHTPREYIFVERGSHGSNAPVRPDIPSSSYDLSRAVRSDRWKFIYNCTPWVRYSPVDSAGDKGWKQIVAARDNGILSPELTQTYFSAPRPVYELYDLENDPSELQNLSGRAEHVEIERRLRIALAEKMILDCDYLPLPNLLEDPPRQPSKTRRN